VWLNIAATSQLPDDPYTFRRTYNRQTPEGSVHTLELKEFEGSLAAIFPDELLEELRVGEGSTLYLSKRRTDTS